MFLWESSWAKMWLHSIIKNSPNIFLLLFSKKKKKRFFLDFQSCVKIILFIIQAHVPFLTFSSDSNSDQIGRF